MTQALDVGVPTPEVLGVEHVNHDGGLLSFSIQRLLPGRSLDELVGELSPSDLERFVIDGGELLARIHSAVPDRGIRHQLRLREDAEMARVVRIVGETLGAAAATVVEHGADFLREAVTTRPAPPLSLAQGDFSAQEPLDRRRRDRRRHRLGVRRACATGVRPRPLGGVGRRSLARPLRPAVGRLCASLRSRVGRCWLGASLRHRLGAGEARLEEPRSASAVSPLRRRHRPLRRPLTDSRTARPGSRAHGELTSIGTRHRQHSRGGRRGGTGFFERDPLCNPSSNLAGSRRVRGACW